MGRVGRYVKFSAQAGSGDALAKVLLRVAASLEATPGCELYAINRAADDPDVVWVTEVWASQQSLDGSLAMLRTDEGGSRLAEVQALLAGAPERIDIEPLGGVGLSG
jgi:quinol monooxygenase YgiN